MSQITVYKDTQAPKTDSQGLSGPQYQFTRTLRSPSLVHKDSKAILQRKCSLLRNFVNTPHGVVINAKSTGKNLILLSKMSPCQVMLALAFLVFCTCEEERKKENIPGLFRIHKGNPASSGQFPFVAFIRSPVGPKKATSSCTGSILTATWVITAGHCFLKLETPPNTVVVQAGVIKGDLNLNDKKGSKTNTNGQIRSARQIIVHPKFTTPNAPKDVALIEVAEPFRFSKSVTSIPLSPFQVLKGREKCIIAVSGPSTPPVPSVVSGPSTPPVPSVVSGPSTPPVSNIVSGPSTPPVPSVVSGPSTPPVPSVVSGPSTPPVSNIVSGPSTPPVPRYGSTGPQDRKFTRDLFWMNATINHKCEKNYKCVLHIPEGQRTASGDSGAPVMCKGYLSAIVKGSVTLDKDLNSTLVVQMSSLIPWLKTHIPKVMEEDILARSASGEHGRQGTGTRVVTSSAGLLFVGLFFPLGCKRSLFV
uniref:Peptidase S1 domain-containing protein n=1 Tax=Timema bartmani TaxID=61472 RepID=A0A7R9I1K4_9NEOP|nr:unnamed protein product [Timema bartmani]